MLDFRLILLHREYFVEEHFGIKLALLMDYNIGLIESISTTKCKTGGYTLIHPFESYIMPVISGTYNQFCRIIGTSEWNERDFQFALFTGFKSI
jgi:hypothetical protein